MTFKYKHLKNMSEVTCLLCIVLNLSGLSGPSAMEIDRWTQVQNHDHLFCHLRQ